MLVRHVPGMRPLSRLLHDQRLRIHGEATSLRILNSGSTRPRRGVDVPRPGLGAMGRGMATKRVRDEHLEVLPGIWGEMKALNARIDRTNERLDAVKDELGARLDAVRAELKDEHDHLRRRVLESEVRLATAVTGLSSDVHELSGLIRDWRTEHRADRVELRSRIDRLEEHVGIGRPRG